MRGNADARGRAALESDDGQVEGDDRQLASADENGRVLEERRDARDAQDEFRTATERRDREKDELGMMKTRMEEKKDDDDKSPDERKEKGERERERQSRELVEETDVVLGSISRLKK